MSPSRRTWSRAPRSGAPSRLSARSCATGCGRPRRSASGRVTCTRPASSTRAGHPTDSSSRSPEPTGRSWRSPDRATTSRPSRPPRPSAISRPLARAGAASSACTCWGSRPRRSSSCCTSCARRPGSCERSLRDIMSPAMAEDSCTLVIFGASGDLTKRKLVPALWSMFQGRVLPEPFAVIGVARSEMSNEQFRARMREAIAEFARVQPPSQKVWERFAQALFYYAGDPANPELYAGLRDYLRQVEQERGIGGNRLFYCATPPSLYPPLVRRLGEAGLDPPPRGSGGLGGLGLGEPVGGGRRPAAR